MNAKKKEEKRIKRGLLTMPEHFKKRKDSQDEVWAKNKKNKGKKPFGDA